MPPAIGAASIVEGVAGRVIRSHGPMAHTTAIARRRRRRRVRSPIRMARRRDQLPPAAHLPLDYAPPRTRRPRIVGFVGWICAGIGYASFFLKGSQLPSYLFP